MEKRIEMPKDVADTLYDKLEKRDTAKMAVMVKLPSNISQEEAEDYYKKAIDTFLEAEVDFRLYEKAIMEAFEISSYIRTENLDIIIEE